MLWGREATVASGGQAEVERLNVYKIFKKRLENGEPRDLALLFQSVRDMSLLKRYYGNSL